MELANNLVRYSHKFDWFPTFCWICYYPPAAASLDIMDFGNYAQMVCWRNKDDVLELDIFLVISSLSINVNLVQVWRYSNVVWISIVKLVLLWWLSKAPWSTIAMAIGQIDFKFCLGVIKITFGDSD